MKQSIPHCPPGLLKIFTANLLSLAILIIPLAPLAAAAPLNTKSAPTKKSDAKNESPVTPDEASLFVNGLVAPPAPVPAPMPVGAVTATMVGTIVNDDGDSKIDPTNGMASTEKITYTTTLGNTTGTDALGLIFTDTIDTHTTLIGGSLNSTPVAFDQSVTTDEDTAKAIRTQLRA